MSQPPTPAGQDSAGPYVLVNAPTTQRPDPATVAPGAMLIDSTSQVSYSDGAQWQPSGTTPTPEPPPTPFPAKIRAPGDILDLSSWKLGIPRDAKGTTSGVALEVAPPALLTYTSDWFYTNTSNDGVVFVGDSAGATTKGSAYPRCELREMDPDGITRSTWGIDDGKPHILTATVAINELPRRKPQVVFGQIHDPADDVIELMADGFWPTSGTTAITGTDPGEFALKYRFLGATDTAISLVPNYTLGAKVSYRIVAWKGVISLYADLGENEPTTLCKSIVGGWAKANNAKGCYFKIGAYTQSNTRNVGKTVPHRTCAGGVDLTNPKGGAPTGAEDTTGRGIVTVYSVSHTHG